MLKLNRNLLVKIYIIVSLIVFSFVGTSDSTWYMGIVVPHIEAPQFIIHALFLILFTGGFLLFSMFCHQSIRVDVICGCLFIKCILDIIPVLAGTASINSYTQFYMCTVVSFVTYLIMINSRFTDTDFKKIQTYFTIFSFLLGLQVIYTFIRNPVSYGQFSYKMNMVIPYGGSNVIASVLVPIICLVYLGKLEKIKKIFIIGFILLSIFLTCSRGGMLLAGVTLFFLFFSCSESRTNKSLKRAGVILILLGIVVYFFTSEEISMLFRLTKRGTTSGSILQYFSNGRFDLWRNAFSEMDDKIFFGIGMYPDKYSVSGLHNIVLDILLRCGVIGTINYLTMFAILIKKGYYTYKSVKNPYFMMVCVVYINSLYELSYFYYNTDTMLWMYIGLMMSVYYRRNEIATDVSNNSSNLRCNQI